MALKKTLTDLWKRVMLRDSAFTASYGRIRTLYTMEDPWEMESAREQHRFKETMAQLGSIAPRFPEVLELGCGEGHQSLYLMDVSDALYGVDISEAAIRRARQRCAGADFRAARLEDISNEFADKRFDLITACEVLYYAVDTKAILAELQAKTDRLYVSNYLKRSEAMKSHFQGDGWQQLDRITFEDTIWECYLWQSPRVRES